MKQQPRYSRQIKIFSTDYSLVSSQKLAIITHLYVLCCRLRKFYQTVHTLNTDFIVLMESELIIFNIKYKGLTDIEVRGTPLFIEKEEDAIPSTIILILRFV